MSGLRANFTEASADGWGLGAVVGCVAAAGLALFALAASGCGPGENPCGGCKLGVCDEASGECVNASSCTPPSQKASGDAGMQAADAATGAVDAGTSRSAPPSDCLEGYSCQDGSCVADESCTADSDPCENGVCSNGRCVNSDRCVQDSACLPDYTCSNGSCKYAPCSSTDCDRGVCAPESGECVNADECSEESSETPANCLEGYACNGGECVDKENFCVDSPCDRGVCESKTASCVNAADCDSDDQCLKGKYCTGDGNCEENKCYPVKRLCDRGVCDPADRSCGNPDSCSEAGDCAPMYRCIDGACIPTSEMCGDEGCPGNQVCEFQKQELDAKCIENPNEACRSALDCTDDRVCNSGSCGSPQGCSNDSFESNNTPDAATSFFDNRVDGEVRGQICSNDTDVFAYDTSRDSDFRGKFTVSLNYNPVDVGIGDLKVRVLRPDGSKWFEKRIDAASGELTVQKRFGAGSQKGKYKVIVEDPEGVGRAGIRYRLLVDLVSQQATRACKQAESLSIPNQRGNTSKDSSVGFDASCVRDGAQKPEDLYEFTLNNKSFVDIKLQPDGASDLSLAVREKCELPSTEEACANRGRVGAEETLQETLEAGTYYLVVQASDNDAGGKYTLVFGRQDARCTDDDNQCVNATDVRKCSPRGRQFSELQCPTGCDAGRARCTRTKGDTCSKAIDASGGLNGHVIDWSNTYGDLSSAGAACLPDSAQTDGPDKVFRVDVPGGEVMLADLRPQRGQPGSLYVLDECRDASVYCQKGTSGGNASIRYPNRGGSTDTVYLVADSPAGTRGISKLDVSVEPLVCQPSSRRCTGADVEECNSAGTAWKTQKTCSFGCENAGCKADACKRAVDVSSGGSWTFDPGNYTDDYSVGGRFRPVCFSSRGSFDGPDLVFQAEVPGGEVLEATLTEPSGSTYNAGIYLVEDCSSTQTHENTCFGASKTGNSGTATATGRNNSSSKTTYYIVVDTENSSGTTPSNLKLDVKVKTPTCTPFSLLKCTNSSTLQYCAESGLSKKTYTCSGSSSPKCKNARCQDPTGDVCVDYFDATNGGTFKQDMSKLNDDYSLSRRDCASDTTRGNDAVYRVKAKAGKTISVSANPQDRSDDPVLYIGNACGGIVRRNSSVCVAGTNSARDGRKESLSYKVPAGKGGTYWVFVDGDLSFDTRGTFDININVK